MSKKKHRRKNTNDRDEIKGMITELKLYMAFIYDRENDLRKFRKELLKKIDELKKDDSAKKDKKEV